MQGIIIGLTLAAPIGPISLLCIQRTVADGRLHGIFSGIGVATSDSFYAAVAFMGLTIISGVIIAEQGLFRTCAGVVLIFVGIRVFLSVPPEISARPEPEPYLKDYLSMLAIALANPLTLIFFVAILPGFGVVFRGTSFTSALIFVSGVFSGGTFWWIFLCGSIGSVRSHLSRDHLRLINRVSGIMITCFGAGMLILLIIWSGTGFPV
jgi:threonine/homoserine/homoserine lactone efflux protein